MSNDRVTVIIPACNEKFLQTTIDSLLTNAAGDVEIIAVIDGGPWPDPPLREDKRVIVVRHSDQRGMRPSINEAAQIASGKYLLKTDGHCLFEEGWDAILKEDCDVDWLAVPTRHSIDTQKMIDAQALTGEEYKRALKKAVKPRHWNYTILTFPWLSSMYGAGLHAVTFAWDHNKIINAERAHIPVDDLLSAQGSCWFQHTATFLKDGPLDHANLGFYQESQETMLRRWMRGGRCVVTKRTAYSHMHKGNNDLHTIDGRTGRGFYLDLRRKRASEDYSTEYWLNDRCPGASRTFASLIEQFWPLISQMKDPRYAWPEDWRDYDKYRTWFKNRTADELPAHI